MAPSRPAPCYRSASPAAFRPGLRSATSSFALESTTSRTGGRSKKRPSAAIRRLIGAALGAAQGPGLAGIAGFAITVDEAAWGPAEKVVAPLLEGHDIVEMESFWIGEAAAQARTPFLAIRTISDCAGDRSHRRSPCKKMALWTPRSSSPTRGSTRRPRLLWRRRRSAHASHSGTWRWSWPASCRRWSSTPRRGRLMLAIFVGVRAEHNAAERHIDVLERQQTRRAATSFRGDIPRQTVADLSGRGLGEDRMPDRRRDHPPAFDLGVLSARIAPAVTREAAPGAGLPLAQCRSVPREDSCVSPDGEVGPAPAGAGRPGGHFRRHPAHVGDALTFAPLNPVVPDTSTSPATSGVVVVDRRASGWLRPPSSTTPVPLGPRLAGQRLDQCAMR